MDQEKQVYYNTSNSYTTLNSCTAKTKNVWVVFHGMGYLSRYFINHFVHLNPTENFIIAPQAPSKYYLGENFKHVGASWLTKENTIEDTVNILNYIDAVYEAERPNHLYNLIILGYSQGVSIATRWLASRKIKCTHLVLHSGGIPKELVIEDFSFMSAQTKVTYIYGNKDPYITEARKTEELLKGSNLFGNRLQIEVFEGVHEVNKEFIFDLSK